MIKRLLCLFLWIVLAGCSHSSKPDFSHLYTEAQSRMDTGDLPAALILSETGRMQAEETNLVWNWKFRVLSADIALWQGRHLDALKLLESEPPPELTPEFVVRRRLIQGRASYAVTRLDDADSFLIEAEKISRENVQNLKGEVALARATLFIFRKDHKKAMELLQSALEFAREHKDALLEAKTMGTFGLAFSREASYEDALDYLTASLPRSQVLHARHVEAGILVNTGWSYLELGELQQAESLLKDGERLAAEEGMIFAQEAILNNLGRIHINLGNYVAAAEFFSRALVMARQRDDRFHVGQYLNNLSSVNLELGQFKEAEKNNQEALGIFQQKDKDYHLDELRALLNQVTIAIAEGNPSNCESQLQAIIRDSETPASLRWEAQDELARCYVAKRQLARARAQFQQVISTLDRARAPIRDFENRLAFSFWEAAFHTNYIRFLLDQGDPRGALLVAESMQARDMEEGLNGSYRQPAPLRIPAIQDYLRKHNQVILSYWLAPRESYLWVVTPSQLRYFLLPGKTEIEKKVDAYQMAITGLEDVEQSDPGGQDLFRMLVEPARPLIPSGARVVVIPDGGLGKLNFETLLVPGTPPHFWIRDVELENASSIALLIKPRTVVSARKKLLLMGAPEQAHPDYAVLAFAGNEMEKVSNHFSPAQKLVISGKDATPAAYDAAAPGRFEVIDFVTHGVASETRPLESAIVLSAQHDGAFRLYARDIIKKRLNARVVIVSACYGAGKRSYSASGLVGLAWAFLRAGAHQVIAGSWKVDDRSTPQFMDDFYTMWKSGKSASSALRMAKLKMLNSGTAYRLPNFWAALQLYTGS